MVSIGYLGLGLIGLPIAQRLALGGDPMFVFDPRPDARDFGSPGVGRVGSAREVADRAEIVWTCLASEQAHRDALLGPEGLIHGSAIRTHVQLGTTGPELARELSARLAERGIETIDAPIAGGVPRAETGTLTAMVACPKERLEALRPLMERYATEIVWIGEKPGAAQVIKLINNAISFANLVAASEALIIGAKEGLDPAGMLQVLNTSSGQNSATLIKIPRDILTGRFDFGGALRIALKDLHAYLVLAQEAGLDAPIGEAVLRCYEEAAGVLSTEADVTEVIRPMEARAGVELRARK